jgi:hypothetical protein
MFTKRFMADLFWMAVAAVVVTVAIGLLHNVGIDVPTLPRWLLGV